MILEGSVRKAGSHVRITAQLINVEDGFHIWSETYDRELKDIFAVQEDIANRIVKRLRLQIQDSYESRTSNIEAYELALKGSYFLKKGYENTKKSMSYFKKAVELDPKYAKAHALIGETYLYYSGMNLMTSGDAYAKARTYAQRSLDLNPYEPLAHMVMAYVHLFHDWDWEATRIEYEKAIEYGLTEQNEFITYYYIFLNKDYDRAINIAKKRLETDPLSLENQWQLGLCYYFSRKFEEALECFNNTIELDPNFSDGHNWKGVVLGHFGQYNQAIKSHKRALEITGGEGLAEIDILKVKIHMGKKEEVLQEMGSINFTDPGDVAELYVMMGMKDEAIQWLERGYRERSIMMVTIKHSWVWDDIRDDPRFIEIYNRMNF